MNRLPPFLLLLAAADALAHPGHGQSGWFHAHVHEIAVAAIAAIALGLLRLRAGRRRRRAAKPRA